MKVHVIVTLGRSSQGNERIVQPHARITGIVDYPPVKAVANGGITHPEVEYIATVDKAVTQILHVDVAQVDGRAVRGCAGLIGILDTSRAIG